MRWGGLESPHDNQQTEVEEVVERFQLLPTTGHIKVNKTLRRNMNSIETLQCIIISSVQSIKITRLSKEQENVTHTLEKNQAV